MKQKYIAPTIAITCLHQQFNVLAGSPDIMMSEESAQAEEEVLSRRFDTWDDNE